MYIEMMRTNKTRLYLTVTLCVCVAMCMCSGMVIFTFSHRDLSYAMNI